MTLKSKQLAVIACLRASRGSPTHCFPPPGCLHTARTLSGSKKFAQLGLNAQIRTKRTTPAQCRECDGQELQNRLRLLTAVLDHFLGSVLQLGSAEHPLLDGPAAAKGALLETVHLSSRYFRLLPQHQTRQERLLC